ncbi:hypothetical protein D9M69_687160 [compost metagenome]
MGATPTFTVTGFFLIRKRYRLKSSAKMQAKMVPMAISPTRTGTACTSKDIQLAIEAIMIKKKLPGGLSCA